MADQEAEENLNTNPAKNIQKLESDGFMESDEIAFIVDKTGEDKDVIIIGLKAYNTLKNMAGQMDTDVTEDNATGILFKLDQTMDCKSIGSIKIESLKNIKYIKDFSSAKSTADTFLMKKGIFEKEGNNAINCNKSVSTDAGTIIAEHGSLKTNQAGGKPRRKRNKASMKKYKKRKSSTGKKKKIPRRRSRKLRRMK